MREDAALAPLLLFSFKIYLCGREAVFFVFASDYLIFSLAKKLGGLTPAGFRDLREKPGRDKIYGESSLPYRSPKARRAPPAREMQ